MQNKSRIIDGLARVATMEDLDEMIGIYEYARGWMAENGNPNQWINGYPSREVIAMDIMKGVSHVIISGDRIVGAFSFIIGEDPTYSVIEGAWLNDNPYGTIHRIAAAPGVSGIADACLDFCCACCRGRGVDLRIDTYKDNAPMLGWVTSRGFKYCGIIYIANGTPRKAFQLLLN
ncbi:MAG: GNAT family N-acetyltransferase [Muribaculum sp.]|nr:GNAT family N-acetyltransferase [Muribaculum sp.]